MESARFARFFRRAVPRDRPAKLETRSSLGSPLYKYHTLLSASRLVAREHRGERGREGEGERETEPASWAVALGAKVTRPPSALSRPLRSPRRTMDNVHLFYHIRATFNPFIQRNVDRPSFFHRLFLLLTSSIRSIFIRSFPRGDLLQYRGKNVFRTL